MHARLATAFALAIPMAFAGTPFWETKPPLEWEPQEVQAMLNDSPWSQQSRGRSGELRFFLATAKPMQEAERIERMSKKLRGANDSSHQEYLDMLHDEPDKYIVLAVQTSDRDAFANGDSSRIEKDSRLFSGKQQLKPITYFPPSSSDPYLRIVFPRQLDPKAKSIEFAVYVPGQTDPYRRLLFQLGKMSYQGKLEY